MWACERSAAQKVQLPRPHGRRVTFSLVKAGVATPMQRSLSLPNGDQLLSYTGNLPCHWLVVP